MKPARTPIVVNSKLSRSGPRSVRSATTSPLACGSVLWFSRVITLASLAASRLALDRHPGAAGRAGRVQQRGLPDAVEPLPARGQPRLEDGVEAGRRVDPLQAQDAARPGAAERPVAAAAEAIAAAHQRPVDPQLEDPLLVHGEP